MRFDLWNFFLTAANDQQCFLVDDKNARTVQTVYCVFPKATVFYYWFRDELTSNEHYRGLSALDLSGYSRHGNWYANTSQYSGLYNLMTWEGKAAIAWQVYNTTLLGFAYRNDSDSEALISWWENTGNSHPGSVQSQLEIQGMSSRAQVPDNPATPEDELRRYFGGISDTCYLFDDGVTATLATIRCDYNFTDTGLAVSVEYSKWSNEWGMDSFMNKALWMNPGCKLQDWSIKDNMGLQQNLGSLYLCVTEDDSKAYIAWTVYQRLFTGFAVASNSNDVNALLEAWSAKLGLVNK